MLVTDMWPDGAAVAFLVSMCMPYLVMIVHLAVTNELAPSEKKLWRGELWYSWRSLPAVWIYLLSPDLRQATSDLAPVPHDE